MAVIDTPDSVFISDMENSRDVKEIVNILKQKGRREFYSHNTVHFYWGSLTCLEKTEGYALDRITVLPGQTALLNQAVPDAGLLTLINGRAEFCINNNCQDVLPGCIINLSLPCSVTIHNPCERPVNVLAIRLRDEL
jgi:hypothetical protein